jgi:hypothetical protein
MLQSLQAGGKRFKLFCAISLSFVFLATLAIWHNNGLGTLRDTLDRQFCSTNENFDEIEPLLSGPQVRTNVVVASAFSHHHDVYLTVAWTAERVMKNGTLTVYAPLPFGYGFQDVVDELGLFHGTTKNYDELIHDVLANPGDGGIDLIIFGTCEADLRYYGPDLLKAWDARDAAHKFQLVCMVHNVNDVGWQEAVPDWSRRNSIRLLAISEHVVKAFHKAHAELAYSPDPKLSSAGYEFIRADVHVPILDLPNLPSLPPKRVLSNAVIQGYFDTSRRDYERIFTQLIQDIREDPKMWGYLPLNGQSKYIQDNSLSDHPFRLHLAGTGNLDIPPELEEVIVLHTGLNYSDFYNLMGGMDICLPAFAGTGTGYFRSQASSTFAMCTEVDTPLLVTRRVRDAYTYVDDDRVVVTRPAAVREMDAIRALRAGDASSIFASDPSNSGWTLGSHPRIREEVDKMMRQGWIRPKEEFDAVKKNIWHQNDRVIWKILRDL